MCLAVPALQICVRRNCLVPPPAPVCGRPSSPRKMEAEKIRCRKCRTVLLSENRMTLLDAHGEECCDAGVRALESECLSVREQSCLYIPEESFPDFILQAVEESSWTKGKIYCPSCRARLGSFNFVSGGQCACGSHVIPQVHILRSKVDWMKVGEVQPHPVSFPNCSVVLCASSLPLDQPTQTLMPADGDPKESVGPDVPRSFTEDRDATSSPQTSSSRLRRKHRVDVLERSDCKTRHRQKGRKKILSNPPDESSEGPTSRPSCFEVLDDELTGTEVDSSPEEDTEEINIPDNLVCPVCLDVLYSPLVTNPCGHIFCEPCLRRMAKPNPTRTHCPLCRQIIGQCMPCPDLAHDVQNCFFDLYQKRREFELQHNSQHLPLPWTRNYRLMNAYHRGENWLERAGGWRTIIIVMSLNILGIGIILYLGRPAKIQSNLSMV